MRRRYCLILALLPAAAWAGDADWTSYLCEYKVYGRETSRSQLVKVSASQRRVKINDRDVASVSFTDTAIRFSGPRGDWLIMRASDPKTAVSMTTTVGYEIAQGTCRVVTDD